MFNNRYDIEIFSDRAGKEPFVDWLNEFNRDIKKRIISRINRVKLGNLGDYKAIDKNILELRLSFGSGYRIYFGKNSNTLIILLCGGDKKTQTQDIEKAKKYWSYYQKYHYEKGDINEKK